MRVTPLGFYLRVTENEKSLNLEKTTSSVLSVLIYIYDPILDIEIIKGTTKVNLIRIEEIFVYSDINQSICQFISGITLNKRKSTVLFLNYPKFTI